MALWILDASHGGEDFGVIGKNGRKEADIVLEAVLEAKRHLERNGESVILTRDCDKEITIKERIEIANKSKGKYYISFHMNNNIDENIKGVEVLTFKNYDEDDRLARLIKDELLSVMKSEDRGVEVDNDKAYDVLQIKGMKVFGEYLSNEDIEKDFSAKKFGELVAKACLAVVDKVLLLCPITEPKPMQKQGWRVCLGYYKTYDEAEQTIRRLSKEGNKSAFIVPVDK